MKAPYSGLLQSPIGTLEISASDLGIQRIQINKEVNIPILLNDHVSHVMEELKEYFSGELQAFSVPLDLSSGTVFQQSIWKLVSQIPYGSTQSYGEIAQSYGDIKAVRAVGLANGKNPIPIVIPCHRVVGSDGSLTGYSLGLELKRWLLEFEHAHRKAPEGMLF